MSEPSQQDPRRRGGDLPPSEWSGSSTGEFRSRREVDGLRGLEKPSGSESRTPERSYFVLGAGGESRIFL
jgi:hypothetical protein